MKFVRLLSRTVDGDLFRRCHPPWVVRTFCTNMPSDTENNDSKSNNSVESADDFEQRIFGGFSQSSPNTDSFYQMLDGLEKARGRSGSGYRQNVGNGSHPLDGLDETFNTSLSDGMDGKLKKAATYFEFDPEEIAKEEDYAFRPDVSFLPGMTYTTKDLDLTKPAVRKPIKRAEFEVTTEEVLRKADFRNVRFLAKFLTEAGIIIKRSQTRISAKAQRKVAREIKTARAFGLMPFTTMGTKPFVVGKTMEDLKQDDEYDDYDSRRPPFRGNRSNVV